MNAEVNTIHFTLIFKDKEYRVQTRADQYYSLMTLISGHLGIPGFGLCSGMGSCGTCLVEICEAGSKIRQTVLACDVRVNDELANTTIRIPLSTYQ